MWTSRLALVGLVAASACMPSPPATPPDPMHSTLAAMSVEELGATLRERARALRLDTVETAKLERAIDDLLADPAFRDDAERYVVRGTGWFAMGEGGAVVKYANGRGGVWFGTHGDERKFDLRAWSVGAQIGGSSSRGVFVVVGLEGEAAFVGDYAAENASATAVTETTREPLLLRHGGAGHLVYVLDVSKGMSANAGVGRVRLRWR